MCDYSGRETIPIIRGSRNFKRQRRPGSLTRKEEERRAETRDEGEEEEATVADGRRRDRRGLREKRNSLFGRLNKLRATGEQRRRLVDDAETIK